MNSLKPMSFQLQLNKTLSVLLTTEMCIKQTSLIPKMCIVGQKIYQTLVLLVACSFCIKAKLQYPFPLGVVSCMFILNYQ